MRADVSNAEADMQKYIDGVILATEILYGVAWLIVMLSLLGLLCYSPSLVWFVFFMCILWMAIAITLVGAYLPSGKWLDDTCVVLPSRQDDGVANTFVNVSLPSTMENRVMIQNVVTQCFESTQGNLLKQYDIDNATIAQLWEPFNLMNLAPVKELFKVDFATPFKALSSEIDSSQSILEGTTAAGLTNALQNLRSLVANETAAIVSMKTKISATDQSATTIEQAVAADISDSKKCREAGDEWATLSDKGVCSGLAGTFDILWFTFFLCSLGMFFFLIVIAKLTKRIEPVDPNDLKQPLVPKAGAKADYAV